MRIATHLRALVLAATVAALVGATAGPARPAAADGSAINGGGSGFAALEIDQWRADTARKPYSLKINYVSQGSSFGRAQFIAGNLDYGVSDITFLSSELPQLQSKRCGGKDPNSCFAYVPVSAGGLGLMYNLLDNAGKRITNLQLTRRAACKVFTGAILKWNDPEIVATNPQLTTFNRDIVPIIRGDGAGESYVLSQFCQAVAPDVWKAFISDRLAKDPANVAPDFKAGQPVSNWPQGWGRANPANAADGVANTVADAGTGKNAITYSAAGYAKVRNFPVASMQNAAGVYTQPDEANVTVALGYATPNGNGTFKLNFLGSDKRAYFPSTYSYVLAQTTGFDAGKGTTLARFLCYAVSKGQEIAPSLRYARLSAPIVDIAIDAIVRIPGAPAKAACPVAGSAAPPPPASVDPGNANPGSTNDPGGTGGTGGSGGTNGTGGTGGTDGTGGTGGTGDAGTSGGAEGGAGGATATTEPDPLGGGTGSESAAGLPGGGATTDQGTDYSGSIWLIAIGAVLCTIGGAVGSRLRRTG
ncbi:substrate-binding domain-containing protein [Aquihabitans sp. McL0605]|uniref:substrate-binding domain-containing protein n=1 Tax=Aquihabitans sp. McL0605 TaxID=3415671 RepID=UPI003CEED2AF